MLHTSLYTIYVKLDEPNRYLLVHGYTGAIDVVNKEVVKLLKNSKKEITVLSNNLKINTINTLTQRGYITKKTEEEEKNLRKFNR